MEKREFLKKIIMGGITLTVLPVMGKLTSCSSKMKSIFDETKLNNLKLKNRLIRSATWESLAEANGGLNDEIIDIYDELARGGIAAIITGLTDVVPENALARTMGLWNDDVIPDFQRLTTTVRKHDCKILTQIVMGNYRRGYGEGKSKVLEADDLTADDIQNIIQLFTDAAVRAEKSGFDGVQIHSAYSFYLRRFISADYNHRIDDYGGSPKKRVRLLVDILNSIREKCPGLHITIKISYDEDSAEDILVACRELSAHGIDSIEITGNNTSKKDIRTVKDEAYFLDYAASLQETISTPVILVGGHRSMWNMSKVLSESPIEYFSLSRPLIREPNLPNKWKNGYKEPAACISCNACYRTPGRRCIYNIKRE